MNFRQGEQELVEAITEARGPLRICGGETRRIGKPVSGQSLSTSGCSGVRLYEPGALTLVVGAGTPVSTIEQLLAEENQRLAFEPLDYRALLGTSGESTIGGVVATAASGPRRIQVGACRDHLLGVRFVDGTGAVVKNGGRVMKNVTGYDLVKLMAGSFGRLGVISEVSLKVLARPESQTTLISEGLDEAAGIAALTRALNSPYDISGAAHIGGGIDGNSRSLVRIEGLAGSVTYRRDKLLDTVLSGFTAVEDGASEAIWQNLRDVTHFANLEGAVWRCSVKPTDGPVLTAALSHAGLDHKAIFDWGGGLVWLLVDEIADCGSGIIRGEIAKLGGHATLIRATEESRKNIAVFQPEPAPLAKLSAGIRAKFDPRGILNTGID